MGLTEKGKQGILRLFGKHEIDAWNFLFEWHKQKISVDTMPAIAITKEQIEDFEKAHRISLFHDRKHKDCAFAGNEKCYLIPKGCQKDDNEEGCGCWLIDFAPTEVAILQSMNKTHKDCQKFLKYIFRYYHKLPSYMIKASVLKHLENCTGSSSEQNCTLDILKYISKCLDGANLPDPFLSKRNIFGWKEVDLFRTLSPTKTAIIFENHSRFVGLLLQIIQKMTQVNITVYNNSGTSPRPFSTSELRIIEWSMPLRPTNDGVDINDFMDEIEPELKEFISQKKWTTITELRDLTRPYLKDLRWGPIEYFKDTQRKVAQQEQNLNVLL
ncbi:unnamed protein product [Mytilus coruscus]|uniref:Uncharacterized protein n=1 Tax=Mytilus coruscus TaxID=42192 RepID=A0A6J8B369_MYTCO|nr:unnamed protein product [Mytilus coruscus]